MVIMTSGIARGRVHMPAMAELPKMVALLQLIVERDISALVYNVLH